MQNRTEEAVYVREARAGDSHAMAVLLQQHENLIRRAIRPALNLTVLDEEDLVQAGSVALARVVTETWKAGSPLWRQSRRQVVRAAFEEVARALGTSEPTLRRIANAVHECDGNIEEARRYACSKERGSDRVREATFDAIQSALGDDSAYVDDIKDLSRDVGPNQYRWREQMNTSQAAVGSSTPLDPETVALMDAVSDASHVLSDREREVLKRHYGLSGDPQADGDIARALDVDRSVVGKVRRRALAKLRDEIRKSFAISAQA